MSLPKALLQLIVDFLQYEERKQIVGTYNLKENKPLLTPKDFTSLVRSYPNTIRPKAGLIMEQSRGTDIWYIDREVINLFIFPILNQIYCLTLKTLTKIVYACPFCMQYHEFEITMHEKPMLSFFELQEDGPYGEHGERSFCESYLRNKHKGKFIGKVMTPIDVAGVVMPLLEQVRKLIREHHL